VADAERAPAAGAQEPVPTGRGLRVRVTAAMHGRLTADCPRCHRRLMVEVGGKPHTLNRCGHYRGLEITTGDEAFAYFRTEAQ
jgi:hypothetical protein